VSMWSPGSDVRDGPGEAALDQVAPVLDLLQLALDDADQVGHHGHDPGRHWPSRYPRWPSGVPCSGWVSHDRLAISRCHE
jgi:hypothetical protein